MRTHKKFGIKIFEIDMLMIIDLLHSHQFDPSMKMLLAFCSAPNPRDENCKPFSIRKICRLTPKQRKAIFKSLIKGLKSQNINRNQSV